MKTVPSGKFDFCMKGAPAVGGTVGAGYLSSSSLGRPDKAAGSVVFAAAFVVFAVFAAVLAAASVVLAASVFFASVAAAVSVLAASVFAAPFPSVVAAAPSSSESFGSPWAATDDMRRSEMAQVIKEVFLASPGSLMASSLFGVFPPDRRVMPRLDAAVAQRSLVI